MTAASTRGQVLEATARRLRVDLARMQVAGRLPSVVAALVRDGAVVWGDGYGDVPGPADDTQYRIGSITKTVTAVAVLRLAEAGVLDLDDPVRRWWPSTSGEPPYGEVTLRALLGHSAGLPAEPAGPWWERAGRGSEAGALAAAEAGRTAPHPTGRVFHYSNLGYGLLGVVVAQATGTTWWDVVRDEVLAPLGMTRTTYDAQAPAARGSSVHPYHATLLPEPTPDTGAMAPAGQLWSTTADLARWAAFLLDGHDDVLPRAALHRAYAPQVGAGASGPASRHGLGFQLADGLVGHTGSMPGFVAGCFVDPATRTGAVLLSDATTGLVPVAAARTLLDTLEACEPALPEPWRPAAEVPAELAGLLGVWHWGARPQVWALEGSSGVLVAHEGERELHRLAVVDGRVMAVSGYFTGEEAVLRHAADGTAYVDLGTFVLTRTPYPEGDVVPGGTTSV